MQKHAAYRLPRHTYPYVGRAGWRSRGRLLLDECHCLLEHYEDGEGPEPLCVCVCVSVRMSVRQGLTM